MTTDRERAEALHQKANDLAEAGDDAAAEEAYREVIALLPQWGTPWFNLGLVLKRRRAWAEMLRCNLAAFAKNVKNTAALWNAGIAATALGDWAAARASWKGYGLEIPAGEGPIVMDLGPVPIRVNPAGNAEVVWCKRLDPARALIENVPFPRCGRRWHDVVLHDGAPNGYRKLGDQEVPVFDELAVLERSPFETWVAEVEAELPQDAQELVAALEKEGLAAQDWTASVRMLCKACSEGRPDDAEGHDHGPEKKGWSSSRRIGIATRDEATARLVLDAWARARDEREFTLEPA